MTGLKEEQFLLVNTSLDPDQAAAQYQGGNGFSLPYLFFGDLMNCILFFLVVDFSVMNRV